MAFKKKDDDKKKNASGLSALLSAMAKDTQSCYVDLVNIPKEAPFINSGSLAVNLVSGIGGFPVGGLVEVAGEFSSGKTTLALTCAGHVQKAGGIVLFVDFEQAFDPYYAESLGVNITPVSDGGQFILIQPDNLEHGWNALNAIIATGEITLCIIDSVAAGVPKATVEGEAGISRIGLQAQLLSNEYNKLASKCKHSGCTALLLNQIRTKIEQGFRGAMIVSKDTSGGHALKHYCLMRLWMTITTKIDDGCNDDGSKNFVANKVRFQFIKNKCGKPYTSGILIMRYGHGIDNEMAIIEMGLEHDVIGLGGSYYSFNGPDGKEYKVQGKEAARKHLADDPKLCEYIATSIKEALATQ